MCKEIEFLSIPKEFEEIRNKATINLEEIKSFMEELSDLLWGRVFALIDGQTLMPQTIINSTCITLESLINCVENARFTDANILLRKYRDDIFFFLYIICYVKDTNDNVDEKHLDARNIAKKRINSWKRNELKRLYFQGMFDYIKLNCFILEEQFRIQEGFDDFKNKLNNYVHGNGKDYYNKRITQFDEGEFSNQLSGMAHNTAYITVAFLIFLIILAPHLITSSDYEDYLECDETPPDGVQYYVAPFVRDFILKNQEIIDKSILDYLRNNTFMIFD